MASIISGYEYDIFISYRQKDNKHDSWVTEFVNQLKGDLEATFKEDISIYFDENPSDGLLETHSVDKSLEGKLRCLIFIPIISQTYCDPKSYAWQHEFCAFNKLAKEDRFGRDIRLSSGNVASRILPVQIHDLDAEDKKLVENELGGFIRGIEFIYKEPGVNRPLISTEVHPDNNLNKTFYRNQINKVANAIKEILTAIKHKEIKPETTPVEPSGFTSSPKRNNRIKILAGSFTALILIILGILFIPKLIKPPGQLEKSIAVLPFRNDSPSDSNAYFINGLMEEILNKLEKIEALSKVISRTSTEQYRGVAKLSMPKIAKDLDVNYIVEGSGQKYGDTYRLRVQLIEGKSDKHLWSDTYEKEIHGTKDIFNVQTQIAQAIAGELKAVITPDEKNLILQQPTDNALAYDFYLKGIAFQEKEQSSQANEMFSKAIQEDPGFAAAYARRSRTHTYLYWVKTTEGWQNHADSALNDLKKSNELYPDLPEVKIAQLYYYYHVNRDYDNALKIINELKSELPNFADLYTLSGYIFRRKGQFEESIKEQKIGLQLDPFNISRITELSDTYGIVDQFDNGIACARRGLSIFPDFKNFKSQIYNEYLFKTADLMTAIKESGIDENDVQYDIYLYNRQFDKGIEYTKSKSLSVSNQYNYYSTAHILAYLYFLAGNISLCQSYADSAITDLKEKIKEFPDDERYYATLGLSYAYIGKYKDAVACGEKAVKLKPIKLDALQGTNTEINLMGIYFCCGNYDLALDKMEYLLSIPSVLYAGEIKLNPFYDKFRDLPRFKEIINSTHKRLNVN